MGNEELFLKLANPADMLSVRFLSETGQMTGEFLQEADPPWTVWWKLPQAGGGWLGKLEGLLRKPTIEAASVWEPGTPRGRVKRIDWLDVFRQFVITRDDSPLPTDTIILRTTDRALFFEVVRRHFMLQQGTVEFAVIQPTTPVWLVRIKHPSLWALEQLPDDRSWEWFNQVPGCDSLFIERGFGLSAVTNGARLNHFQILDNTVVLLRSKGDLLHFSLPWRHAGTLVEVRAAAPQIPIAEEKEKLQITPRLRETEESRPHSLWRVEDHARLKAIIAAESFKRLSGFSGWFGQDGIFWVLAAGEQADRGLAGVLSDAFPAWVPLEERVFVPAGRALLPRLSGERLCQIFGAVRTDWLVFSDGPEGLQTVCLPATQLRKLEFFVTFLAERTVDAFAGFATKWDFSFPDLKKKE